MIIFYIKLLLSGSDCNKLNDEKDIITHMWLTSTMGQFNKTFWFILHLHIFKCQHLCCNQIDESSCIKSKFSGMFNLILEIMTKASNI